MSTSSVLSGWKSFVKPILISVIISLLAGTVFFVAMAILTLSVDAQSTLVYWLALAGLLFMGFLAGYTAGKLIRHKGLLVGIVVGAVCVGLFLLSSIFVLTMFTSLLTKSAVILGSSLTGSIIGVN